MADHWSYVTPNDEAEITKFCAHHFRSFIGIPPTPLYHYTTGDNLIRIIESKEIWATHISCLNDATEIMYSVEELRKRVKIRLLANQKPELEFLLKKMDERLATPRVEIAPAFLFCLSTKKDHLSQWRAYSGGEGGYSVEFDPEGLRQAGINNQVMLLRVEYSERNHAILLDDVINCAELFYIKGEGRTRAPNEDAWTDEFVRCFLWQLSFLAPCLKHPTYADEEEWRLVYNLKPDDPTTMRFRQRQSMMTRHMPLKLTGPLPITSVMVGPCRHPIISRVAVCDLLLAHGFKTAIEKVSLTTVPYRMV